MIDLAGAMMSMTQLVLVAVVGFVITKTGHLDHEFVRKLTRLLLDVTLPCTILAAVDGASEASTLVIGQAFLLATAQVFLLLATGWACNVLLRTPEEERPIYLYMSLATNTGFIGMAVVTAIYGESSALLSSIFIMVIALFLYSVGFAILDPNSQGFHISLESMVNPSMIASVVAIVMVFAGIQLPQVVSGTLSRIGSMTSTIAMLIVGEIVANSSVKEVLGEWRLYPYIIIRQLVVPALLYFVLRQLIADELLLGVFTVMFAMPVGSMVAPFCEQFGRDATLGGKATVLSTLASFALIPLLVTLMTKLG